LVGVAPIFFLSFDFIRFSTGIDNRRFFAGGAHQDGAILFERRDGNDGNSQSHDGLLKKR
jgi:hypothetical protein